MRVALISTPVQSGRHTCSNFNLPAAFTKRRGLCLWGCTSKHDSATAQYRLLGSVVGAPLVAECPAKSRAGAVVTPGKARRRPAVPVVVDRDIPRQVSSKFDVVGGIQVELHAAGIGDARHKDCLDATIGLVEPEEL